jgi:prophage antirepressor-like protein
MTNQISVFKFKDMHPVRLQFINDEHWFCLPDVAAILDIKNTSQLSNQIDEKGVCKTYILTSGGNQQLTFINEPNLYRVIFRSNKPEAKQFQDWVFNEVLPSIRKTGTYAANQTIDPAAALNDPVILRSTLLTYSERAINSEGKIEEMQPAVEEFCVGLTHAKYSHILDISAQHTLLAESAPVRQAVFLSPSFGIYGRVACISKNSRKAKNVGRPSNGVEVPDRPFGQPTKY